MVKPSFRAAKEQVVEGYKVIRDGAKKRFARKPAAPRAPRAPRPPSLAAFKAGLKAKIIELARHEGTRDVKAGPNGLTLHIAHENEAAAQEARESLLKLVEDHHDAFAKAGWSADVTASHPDGRSGSFHHYAITFSGSKSTPLGRLFRRDAAGLVSALNDAASRELVRKAPGGSAPSAPAPSRPPAAPAKPPAPAPKPPLAPAKPPASPGSPSRPPAPAPAPAPGSPARPPIPFSAGSPAKPPAAPSGPAPAPAPKPPASPGSPSRPLAAPASSEPSSPTPLTPAPHTPAPADVGHGAVTPPAAESHAPAPSTPAPSSGRPSGKGSGIHFAPVINVTGGNPVANTGRGGVNIVSGEGAQGNIYQDGLGGGRRRKPKKGK